ncbi:MAG: SipW-dependent-type signal peptide-containing protein [Clostridia bacterium]|nr:SipW-dependent-type signal peptide-containing protein [Clostridia bacterium]
MNNTKKKVLVAALAICLVAILSLGTLAWFTAEDSVTNEFLVGDSTTDPDKVFGIDVWETVNGTEYGKDTANDQGATYEAILPGEILNKVPYLTNTGIHPQYVRAIVTVTEADILKEAMTPKGSDVSEWYNVEKFLPGAGDKWTCEYTYYTNKDTFVFVYYYNEALAAGATTQQLFDAVVIPTELTKEQAADMEKFSVSILGQVIQSEHLADVTNAKEAFAKYWDEPGVVAGVSAADLISFPLTGNLGTVDSDLYTYDPADHTDPSAPGVLFANNLTATVKAGASLITVPASQSNVTMVFEDANFTVEDGGKIIDCPHQTGQIIISNVTINGVKIDSSNAAEMSAKYFSGLGLY